MTRRRRLLAGAGAVAVAGAVALVTLWAFGVDLPGPRVRERLGLVEKTNIYAPCRVEDRNLREPAGAPASEAVRWRTEPPLPTRRDEPKAILNGGEIWILGGATPAANRIASLAEILAFDPRSRRYRVVARMPARLDHVAAGAHRGDVLVAGGYSDAVATDRVWRFDVAERRWSAGPALDRPLAAPGSAMLDSRLYVVGGTQVSSFDEKIFERVPEAGMRIYDFDTGEWSRGPDMPTPRHHLALAAHDGRLYALGGRTKGDFSSDAVERYDPRTDRWERRAPMPLGVGGVAAESAGETVLVTGGGDDRERWLTPATWSFDPALDRWTRLADLREPRHGHALAVSRARAYVFGGAPCSGFGLARTVESTAVP